MLALLDVLLTLVHGAVVLANLFLWIPRRTRRWHLGVVAATAASWFLLGPALGYGWGYCFLTDWHWQVKRALGEQHLPPSFIHLMFRSVGIENASWIPTLTATAFACVAVLSIILNARPSALSR